MSILAQHQAHTIHIKRLPKNLSYIGMLVMRTLVNKKRQYKGNYVNNLHVTDQLTFVGGQITLIYKKVV